MPTVTLARLFLGVVSTAQLLSEGQNDAQTGPFVTEEGAKSS